MLPGDNEFDALIDELVNENNTVAVNVELTPVSVSVSTSAKEEEEDEDAGEDEGDDDKVEAVAPGEPPVRRRGRPRKVRLYPNPSPMLDLPEDPADAIVGVLGENLSHMSPGQRRRYWEARIAADARRKMRAQ